MSTKKTRPDSKLKTLPEDRQAEICDYAREHTLAETQAWLAEDGIRIGITPLQRYLAEQRERACQERILVSIASGAQFCNELDRTFKKHPAPEVEQLMRVLRVLVMQLAAKGECDLEYLHAASPLILRLLQFERNKTKDKEVGLTERRVVILEKKAAQAEEAEKVTGDGTLTPEQKQSRMREIFGLG